MPSRPRGFARGVLVFNAGMIASAAVQIPFLIWIHSNGGPDLLHRGPPGTTLIRLAVMLPCPTIFVATFAKMPSTLRFLQWWMAGATAVLACESGILLSSHPGGAAFVATVCLIALGGLALARTRAFKALWDR